MIFLQENVWFGEYSFFTNLCRLESAKSVKYTSIIQIEKSSFLKLISETSKDYVFFFFFFFLSIGIFFFFF